jgi:invasion protein IalB
MMFRREMNRASRKPGIFAAALPFRAAVTALCAAMVLAIAPSPVFSLSDALAADSAAKAAPVQDNTTPDQIEKTQVKEEKAAPFRDADGRIFGSLKSTTGAWSTVCNQQDKTACLLIQRVASEERPEVVLSVTLLRYIDPASKKPVTVLRTALPLEAHVYLPAGVGLYVDGVDLGRSYFVLCSSLGCFSDAVLSDPVLEKLKSGKQAVFTVFLSAEEDGMGIPVDLTGISDGLKSL